MADATIQKLTKSRGSKLAAALNISPGEGLPTFLLFAQAFCLGIALITIYTASNAIFLTAFTSDRLPYVYITAAVIIIAAGVLFSQLQRVISLPYLLSGTLGLLLVTAAGLWIGLRLGGGSWLAFMTLVWSRIYWVLGNLELWALAGRLFNVRQGKRLFSLITAGAVLGVILFGLLTSAMIRLIGTVNMILITTLALAVAMGILIYTLRRFHDQIVTRETSSSAMKKPGGGELLALFRNPFIILIFIYTAFSTLGTYVLDFAFITEAGIRFINADALGKFFGNYLAVTTFANLLFLTLAAGFIISRFGLRSGIMADPVMVGIGAVAVIIASIFPVPALAIFWLVVLTKFFDDVMVVSMTNTSVRILYQPLRSEDRVTAQVAVESIIAPLAIGFSGVLLLIFASLGNFGGLDAIKLLMVVVVIWIMAGIMLSNRYKSALGEALKKRVIDETEVNFNDSSSLAVLENALRSSQPGEVLYAIEVLDNTRPETIKQVMLELLQHPTSEVRREALRKIKHYHLVESLPAVRKLLETERDPRVIAEALQATCALDQTGALGAVTAYLNDPDPIIRHGAIIGLAQSGNPAEVSAARLELSNLVASAEVIERARSAEIIGELGLDELIDSLLVLLHDPNPVVRKAALKAAGKLKNQRLWPAVIDNLHFMSTRQAAVWALANGDDTVLPVIKEAFFDPISSLETKVRLLQATGNIKQPDSLSFLKTLVDSPETAIRSQALLGLYQQHYRADVDEQHKFRGILREEVGAGARLIATSLSLQDQQDGAMAPLARALSEEYLGRQDRVYYLLACLYEPHRIGQIQKNLRFESEERQAYALEALDLMLTQADKEMVMALLQPLPDSKRAAQLNQIFPQVKLSAAEAVSSLLEDGGPATSDWTKACAIYASGHHGFKTALENARKLDNSLGTVSQETLNWAESQSKPMLRELDNTSQGNIPMLLTVEKVIILKSVAIFSETPETVLANLAQVLEEVNFEAGQPILKEGDIGDSLYIIIDGEVRVHTGDHTLTVLSDRDVFGEMALLDPEPRSASITALKDTRLLELEQDAFKELLDEQMEIVLGIMRVLTRRLRSMNIQEG